MNESKGSLTFIISGGIKRGTLYNFNWTQEREMAPICATNEKNSGNNKLGFAGSFCIDEIDYMLMGDDFSIAHIMIGKRSTKTLFFYDVNVIHNGEPVKPRRPSFKIGDHKRYAFTCKYENYKVMG